MLKGATKHAQARMQQRGISESLVRLLFRYGSSQHDHRGGEILFMDGVARRRLRQSGGRGTERRFDKALNSYLVIGRDGQIITAGKRYRRLKRH